MRPMSPKQIELAEETLARTQSGRVSANDLLVMVEFTGRGIPAESIIPRINVFTYNVWRLKGRQVRKGEKGVKIASWRPIKHRDQGAPSPDAGKSDGQGERVKLYCAGATVFHISQTDPIEGSN